MIALAAIEQLELLRLLHREVVIPEAVWNEVTARGLERPGARVVREAPWLRTVRVEPPPDVFLQTELGVGEAEAIALAIRSRAMLLLDDRDARRIAATVYRLSVRGVAGTLVAARRRTLIDSVRPMLERLSATGYRIHRDVIDRACREVGE